MRYISQLFQPLITIPKNAKVKNTEITCKSQKLLLECGLVHPTSAGLFTLLPLAQRALDKLEALVQSHMEAVGFQKLSLPVLTPASLWERSGRLQEGGPELMTVTDRHDKRHLLAPTHEEAIADLLADVGPLSHKQLPLLLYQTGPKYRDEARPKHGLLRAREFRMMDAYGAHRTGACAQETYARVSAAYRRLFQRLKLPVYRVEAPSGEMGGSLSHEWQLCARAGEDETRVCPSCSHAARGEGACARCGGAVQARSSIEVGHTFVLGARYTEPLGAGGGGAPHMTCFGVGLTRLLAASVEVLSSEVSIRWPKEIAPYKAIVIGPKAGSREWQPRSWDTVVDLAGRIEGTVGDALVDDRHSLTIGKRLLMADRMGYPYIVVCGRHSLETPPRFELRGLDEMKLLTADQLVDAIREDHCNDNVQIDDGDDVVNKVVS